MGEGGDGGGVVRVKRLTQQSSFHCLKANKSEFQNIIPKPESDSYIVILLNAPDSLKF